MESWRFNDINFNDLNVGEPVIGLNHDNHKLDAG